MRVLLITYVIFIITLCSCDIRHRESIHQNPFPNYEDKFTLIEKAVISLPLDSMTATGESNFQYFENSDSTQYFCYLSRNENSILFYNLEQSELDFKLKLKKEGPDGVGTITGFLVHNLDSIYVYQYRAALLHLVNRQGRVLRRYDLKSTDSLSLYSPYVSSYMPMTKVGESMYFNAWGARKEYSKNTHYPENLTIRLDLIHDSLDYSFRYPDIYKTGIWGTQLHVMYNTYNPNINKFIYSFPIDHYVYITDHQGAIIQKYAGSHYLDQVKPISQKNRISPPPPDEEVKMEAIQATYRSIKYDPYNDMYFRVVFKGISEEDYHSNHPIKSKFSKASIIILDNRFEKVGEVDLENYKFWPNNIFFTREGFHIMQMDFEDEDNLKISVMKVVEQ